MVKEDDVSSSGLFLRPDGHLGGTGFDADDGAGLLALLTGRAPSGDDAARSYFRRLAADHVRRLVVAAEDGRMPTARRTICRSLRRSRRSPRAPLR